MAVLSDKELAQQLALTCMGEPKGLGMLIVANSKAVEKGKIAGEFYLGILEAIKGKSD